MKKVKLNIKAVMLAIALASLCSFNLKAQDDYIILKKDGKKIIVGNDAAMGPDILYFHDKNSKRQEYRQKHVKFFTFGGRIFIGPSNSRYLEEIICYNDKYILTSYTESGNNFAFYAIYDWTLKEMSTHNRQDLGGMWGGGKAKKIEKFSKNVEPYFGGDCKSVIDKMTNNINTDNLLFKEMFVEKCGTKDISEFLKAFLSGQIDNGK
jgi:hypothetical protein